MQKYRLFLQNKILMKKKYKKIQFFFEKIVTNSQYIENQIIIFCGFFHL